MTAIVRRSVRAHIPASTELAAADDLNGVQDGSKNLDVTGAQRVVIAQIDNGAAGTAGIDTIQISHDGGESWVSDPTILALASDDNTGTLVANAALNAAGVEPASGVDIFKSGPHAGPTLMRCVRYVTDDAHSVAWQTGAPQVIAFPIY